MPDLCTLIQGYPVESYAIAENGGLILGFGQHGYLEFGDRREPDKVLEHMNKKYDEIEDMPQGMRLTEVILRQDNVSKRRLDAAIKATKAKVDVHPSRNSYHISKRNIDKGTAMLELCERLNIGNRMIIAIGDADMDIPMFKNANHSFAVGNASDGAKKAATNTLNGKFEKGVSEIVNMIV